MSVVVVGPNARRYTVKVTPNTTIAEILQNVCTKLNLNYNCHSLFRNNKPLDLSLTVRFANLPNNCQLDLKASDERKESNVFVALQRENGERKMGEFSPDYSLQMIVEKLHPNLNLSSNQVPSILYMRREITGDDLKSSTLRSLGLTSGGTNLHLLVREKDSSRQQAFSESLILKKSVTDQFSKKSAARIDPIEQEDIIKTKWLKTGESLEQEKSNTGTQMKQNIAIESQGNQQNEVSMNEEIPSTSFKTDDSCMEIDDDKETQIEEIIHLLDDNNSIVFKQEDIPRVRREDLPDEFFEVTKDDMIVLLNDLRKQQNNDVPLETKQLREQKAALKAKHYSATVLRVCFPQDKLVLQTLFKPQAAIEEVIHFIRGYLKNPQLAFYLYTTPPKRVLDCQKSLLDYELVPAAIIYFGMLNKEFTDKVLKPGLLNKISSFKGAAKIANEARKKNPTISEFQAGEQLTTNMIRDNISIPVQNIQQSSTGRLMNLSDQSKLPKWFKPLR